MASINEMELQTLRHLILSNDTLSCKMASYAEQAQTPEIKRCFQRAARSAADAKTKL